MDDSKDIKDCCQDVGQSVRERLSEDLEVRKCRVCGCRHFELSIDPAELGAMGSG